MSLRDNRSYKDATLRKDSPKNPRIHDNRETMINPQISDSLKPTQHKTHTQNPKLIKPKPSYHRIMNSRALGEETEQIRNSLGEIDANSDYAASMRGSKCEENVELFRRSAIAVASSSLTSDTILNHILSEGVTCLTIKTMGGMQHLIIFETYEDKEDLMNSQWLLQWFDVVTNVNDQSATLWRKTQINIYGVPLIAWGYEIFFNIGCVLGRVISVDYRNYEYATVVIITDCLFEVNCKLMIEIDGKKYDIYVGESGQAICQCSKSDHGIKMTLGKKNNSSPTLSSPEEQLNWSQKSAIDPNAELGIIPTELSPQPQVPQAVNSCNYPINGDISPIVSPSKEVTKSSHMDLNDSAINEIPRETTPQLEQKAAQSIELLIPLTSPSSLLSSIPKQLTPHTKLQSPSSENAKPKNVTFNFGPSPHRSPSITISSRPLHSQPIQDTSKADLASSPSPPLPLPLSNILRTLMKPSPTTSHSSSLSGPLFPPGYENLIPLSVKKAHEMKRSKKVLKKK